MSSTDVQFLKGYEMIQFHIGSTQESGVVFKLEKFSHLSERSFRLGSLIRLLRPYQYASFFIRWKYASSFFFLSYENRLLDVNDKVYSFINSEKEMLRKFELPKLGTMFVKATFFFRYTL